MYLGKGPLQEQIWNVPIYEPSIQSFYVYVLRTQPNNTLANPIQHFLLLKDFGDVPMGRIQHGPLQQMEMNNMIRPIVKQIWNVSIQNRLSNLINVLRTQQHKAWVNPIQHFLLLKDLGDMPMGHIQHGALQQMEINNGMGSIDKQIQNVPIHEPTIKFLMF